MQIYKWLVLGLLLHGAAAHAAEVDIDLSVGFSEERQDNTNQWSFGALTTFGESTWWLKPEIGIQRKTYPLYGGLDREYTVGALKTWTFERSRLFLGGGYAHANYQQGANEGTSNGPFARVGVMWPIASGRFSMGVDFKKAWLRPWTSFGTSFDPEYSQITMRFGWRL